MRVKVVKIGSGVGVRLPKRVLRQCGIDGAVELRLRGSEIVLCRPGYHPQKGWDEAFQRCSAENGQPAGSMWPDEPNNSFETEWLWPEDDLTEADVAEAKTPET